MALSKAQILACDDRKYAEVDVPEWGGNVRLRSMNAEERLEYEETLKKTQTGADGMDRVYSMLVLSLVDDEGNRLFTEDEIGELKRKNPRVILALASKAADLNVLTEASAERVKGE